MGAERSDLNWLSFRYVNGELDAAESLVFEGRLAVDQAAREAVAEAVALVGAVAALPDSAPSAWRRAAWHPVRWTAAAAVAASLALALGLRDRGSSDLVDVRQDSIALTWSDLREPLQIDVDSDAADTESASVESAPPSWMFEVTTAPGADSGEG